jgi:transcriptional regulator with XRE-family HTH domain
MSDIFPISEADAQAGWYSNEAATFGDRVAAGREALGFTQTDLAKRLGVKLKTVQNWEDDLSEPRANKLQMLAGVLNVSLMWLLNGEGDGLDAPGEQEISADMASVLSEIREMRLEATETAARLGRLEKRLRKALEGARV